jgi:hypothetical protein
MSNSRIPEIRASLAQQEIRMRSLTRPAHQASERNKETDHEQGLVHHWSFPWHWRGNREGGVGVR